MAMEYPPSLSPKQTEIERHFFSDMANNVEITNAVLVDNDSDANAVPRG